MRDDILALLQIAKSEQGQILDNCDLQIIALGNERRITGNDELDNEINSYIKTKQFSSKKVIHLNKCITWLTNLSVERKRQHAD